MDYLGPCSQNLGSQMVALEPPRVPREAHARIHKSLKYTKYYPLALFFSLCRLTSRIPLRFPHAHAKRGTPRSVEHDSERGLVDAQNVSHTAFVDVCGCFGANQPALARNGKRASKTEISKHDVDTAHSSEECQWISAGCYG